MSTTHPPGAEDFWPALEQKICTQIKDLDRQIDSLHQERARLQFFLNDHGRKCSGGGEG